MASRTAWRALSVAAARSAFIRSIILSSADGPQPASIHSAARAQTVLYIPSPDYIPVTGLYQHKQPPYGAATRSCVHLIGDPWRPVLPCLHAHLAQKQQAKNRCPQEAKLCVVENSATWACSSRARTSSSSSNPFCARRSSSSAPGPYPREPAKTDSMCKR